jgi:hypothetical protein
MGFSFVQMKQYNAGAAFSLSAAAAHVGGNTTYTGSLANDLAGHSVVITGFTNGANNGTFTVQSNTTTTMTVNNGGGVAETHAGTATFNSVEPIFVQITPTTGNWLIVATWIGNGSQQTVSSITDTLGNAYSFCTGAYVFNGGVNSGTSLQLWYAPVTTGGATTVTVNWPSAGGYSNMSVAEYSGITAFDFGTNLGGSQTTPTITLGTINSNELLIWALLDQGFTTIVWNQSAMVSRASVNDNGPVANQSYSFGEQPNPQYYTTGSTTFGSATQIIMTAAVFKTNTTVNNALSPYIGYGVYDCGGIALPAQEATSTIFANQFNFLPAPVTGGSRGPTNSGVAYQGAGGGATSGFGQIYPTGRKAIG